jgi:hypothetical protein
MGLRPRIYGSMYLFLHSNPCVTPCSYLLLRYFDEEFSNGASRRDIDLGLRNSLSSKRVFFTNRKLYISISPLDVIGD